MRRALPAFVRAASRFACGVAFGLVVAIIAQAYQDAHSSRPSLAHPARAKLRS